MKAVRLAFGFSAVLAAVGIAMSVQSLGSRRLTHVRLGPVLIDGEGIAIADALVAGPIFTRLGGHEASGVSLSNDQFILAVPGPATAAIERMGVRLERTGPEPQRAALGPAWGLDLNHGGHVMVDEFGLEVRSPRRSGTAAVLGNIDVNPHMAVRATRIAGAAGGASASIFGGAMSLDGTWPVARQRDGVNRVDVAPWGTYGLSSEP